MESYEDWIARVVTADKPRDEMFENWKADRERERSRTDWVVYHGRRYTSAEMVSMQKHLSQSNKPFQKFGSATEKFYTRQFMKEFGTFYDVACGRIVWC